jgi:hypothetical protein
MIARRFTIGLAVGALALAGTGCIGNGGGARSGELRVAEVDGRVTVRTPGESTPKVLAEGDGVPVGSDVRTERDATIRLTGAPGQALELLAETRVTLLTTNRVALEIGRALGQSGERPISIVSRGVTARTTGAIRVLRGLGTLSVGVYEGSARVELLGRGLDVPALREVVIAGGIPLDRGAVPLTLSANDRWDRLLLGDVLDFDRELDQFGRGFDSEFGRGPIAPAFFAGFVAVRDLSFVGASVPAGVPSEVLVGLVFSLQLALREGGEAAIPELFAQLRSLREQGATWGLIAKEKGLDLRLLIGAVVDAIRRGTAPPAPPASGTGGGSVGANGGGGGGGQPRSTPSPRPTASPSPTPTTSPSPRPTSSPCSVLERLLGQCPSPQGGGGSESGGGSGQCSVVGVLLDPDC